MTELIHRKLRSTDAGQMIIIISITMLILQTFGNTIYFEPYFPAPLCFTIKFIQSYISFVYLLLLAAESVNLLIKVGLVFSSIDYFPLKASLIAWSESTYSINFHQNKL